MMDDKIRETLAAQAESVTVPADAWHRQRERLLATKAAPRRQRWLYALEVAVACALLAGLLGLASLRKSPAPAGPDQAPPVVEAPPSLGLPPEAPVAGKATLHRWDLDGDGTAEEVTIRQNSATVTRTDGTTFLASVFTSTVPDLTVTAKLLPLAGGAPVLALAYPYDCKPATAGIYALYRFDSASGRLERLQKDLPSCVEVMPGAEPGLIQVESYPIPLAHRQTYRWSIGGFHPTEVLELSVMLPLVRQDNLHMVIRALLDHGERVQGAASLFATPELYGQFLAKVGDGRTWMADPLRPTKCADSPTLLPLKAGGEPAGGIRVTVACDGKVRITGIE